MARLQGRIWLCLRRLRENKREAASKTIKRPVPGRPGLAAVISPTSCELYRRPKRWTPNLLFSGDTAKPTRELNTRLTAICNHPPNERRKSCRAKSSEKCPLWHLRSN
jgi:hypothetical protein